MLGGDAFAYVQFSEKVCEWGVTYIIVDVNKHHNAVDKVAYILDEGFPGALFALALTS